MSKQAIQSKRPPARPTRPSSHRASARCSFFVGQLRQYQTRPKFAFAESTLPYYPDVRWRAQTPSSAVPACGRCLVNLPSITKGVAAFLTSSDPEGPGGRATSAQVTFPSPWRPTNDRKSGFYKQEPGADVAVNQMVARPPTSRAACVWATWCRFAPSWTKKPNRSGLQENRQGSFGLDADVSAATNNWRFQANKNPLHLAEPRKWRPAHKRPRVCDRARLLVSMAENASFSRNLAALGVDRPQLFIVGVFFFSGLQGRLWIQAFQQDAFGTSVYLGLGLRHFGNCWNDRLTSSLVPDDRCLPCWSPAWG